MLRQQGFSYMVISPKITAIDKRHQDYYKRLMSEGRHAFEVPFLAARANKPPSIFFSAVAPGGEVRVKSELRSIASSAEVLGSHSDPQLIEHRIAALNKNPRARPASLAVERFSARSEMRTDVYLVNLISPMYIDKFQDPQGINTVAAYVRAVNPEIKISTWDMYGRYERSEEERRKTWGQMCDDVVNAITAGKPRVVGFSVKWGSVEILDAIMKGLDKQMGENRPLVVLGNTGPTFAYKEFLEEYQRYGPVIAVVGEGEAALEQIAKIAQKNPNFRDVELYRDIVNVVVPGGGEPKVRALDLEGYPMADEVQAQELLEGGTGIETSRGCPWGVCAFCSLRGLYGLGQGKWRPFPLDQVFHRMEQFLKKGKRSFYIIDSEFMGPVTRDEDFNATMDRAQDFAGRVMALNEKYQNENGPIRISVLSVRADNLIADPGKPERQERIDAVFRDLKKAGLKRVYLGIESGDHDQFARYVKGPKLDAAKKPIDNIERNKRAIEKVRELGFDLEVGFIFSGAEDGIKTLKNNVKFIGETKLYETESRLFGPLRVQAGSAFVTKFRKAGLLGDQLDLERLSYSSKHLDSKVEEIENLFTEWEKASYNLLKYLRRAKPVYSDQLSEEERGRQINVIQRILLRGREIDFRFMKEITGLYPEKTNAAGVASDFELRKRAQGVIKRFTAEREALFDQIRDAFDSKEFKDDEGLLNERLLVARSANADFEINGIQNVVEKTSLHRSEMRAKDGFIDLQETDARSVRTEIYNAGRSAPEEGRYTEYFGKVYTDLWGYLRARGIDQPDVEKRIKSNEQSVVIGIPTAFAGGTKEEWMAYHRDRISYFKSVLTAMKALRQAHRGWPAELVINVNGTGQGDYLEAVRAFQNEYSTPEVKITVIHMPLPGRLPGELFPGKSDAVNAIVQYARENKQATILGLLDDDIAIGEKNILSNVEFLIDSARGRHAPVLISPMGHVDPSLGFWPKFWSKAWWPNRNHVPMGPSMFSFLFAFPPLPSYPINEDVLLSIYYEDESVPLEQCRWRVLRNKDPEAEIVWKSDETFFGGFRHNYRWELGDRWVKSLLGKEKQMYRPSHYFWEYLKKAGDKTVLQELKEKVKKRWMKDDNLKNIAASLFDLILREIFINHWIWLELKLRQMTGRPIISTRWAATVPSESKSIAAVSVEEPDRSEMRGGPVQIVNVPEAAKVFAGWSAEDVVRFFKEYGLGELRSIRFKPHNGRNIPILETDQGAFCLKKVTSLSSRDPAGEMLFIADIIHQNKRKGIPIPVLYRSGEEKPENLFFSVADKGANPEEYFIVEKWIDEFKNVHREEARPEMLDEVVKWLAASHAATVDVTEDRWKGLDRWTRARNYEQMEESRRHYREAIIQAYSPEESETILGILDQAFPRVWELSKRLPRRAINTDMNIANCFFDAAGKVRAITDWEDVRMGHRMEDFTSIIFRTGHPQQDYAVDHLERTLIQALRVYQRSVGDKGLTDEEIDILPAYFLVDLMGWFYKRDGAKILGRGTVASPEQRAMVFRTIHEIRKQFAPYLSREKSLSSEVKAVMGSPAVRSEVRTAAEGDRIQETGRRSEAGAGIAALKTEVEVRKRRIQALREEARPDFDGSRIGQETAALFEYAVGEIMQMQIPTPEKVAILSFGSVARRQMLTYSDGDLIILCEDPGKTEKIQRDIKQGLEEVGLGNHKIAFHRWSASADLIRKGHLEVNDIDKIEGSRLIWGDARLFEKVQAAAQVVASGDWNVLLQRFLFSELLFERMSESYSAEEPNLKYSKGYLRDLLDNIYRWPLYMGERRHYGDAFGEVLEFMENHGAITSAERRQIKDAEGAFLFVRNELQLLNGNETDVLKIQDRREIAKRLGIDERLLIERLQRHSNNVAAISKRLWNAAVDHFSELKGIGWKSDIQRVKAEMGGWKAAVQKEFVAHEDLSLRLMGVWNTRDGEVLRTAWEKMPAMPVSNLLDWTVLAAIAQNPNTPRAVLEEIWDAMPRENPEWRHMVRHIKENPNWRPESNRSEIREKKNGNTKITQNPWVGLTSEEAVLVEHLLRVAEKNNLRTDHAKNVVIPGLADATRGRPGEFRAAIAMAIRLAERGIPFCSCLEFGVPFALNISKGDIEEFNRCLLSLEELADILWQEGVNPYRTFVEGQDALIKFGKNSTSLRATLTVARLIPQWFKAARDKSLSDLKLKDALGQLIAKCDTLETLKQALELEIVFVAHRKEAGETQGTMRVKSTECGSREDTVRKLRNAGYKIINDGELTGEEYEGAALIRRYNITYIVPEKNAIIYHALPFYTRLNEYGPNNFAAIVRRARSLIFLFPFSVNLKEIFNLLAVYRDAEDPEWQILLRHFATPKGRRDFKIYSMNQAGCFLIRKRLSPGNVVMEQKESDEYLSDNGEDLKNQYEQTTFFIRIIEQAVSEKHGVAGYPDPKKLQFTFEDLKGFLALPELTWRELEHINRLRQRANKEWRSLSLPLRVMGDADNGILAIVFNEDINARFEQFAARCKDALMLIRENKNAKEFDMQRHETAVKIMLDAADNFFDAQSYLPLKAFALKIIENVAIPSQKVGSLARMNKESAEMEIASAERSISELGLLAREDWLADAKDAEETSPRDVDRSWSVKRSDFYASKVLGEDDSVYAEKNTDIANLSANESSDFKNSNADNVSDGRSEIRNQIETPEVRTNRQEKISQWEPGKIPMPQKVPVSKPEPEMKPLPPKDSASQLQPTKLELELRGVGPAGLRPAVSQDRLLNVRADRMVRSVRMNAQPATVFVDAEDFLSFSALQKQEYLFVMLSNKAVRMVVYNARSEIRDDLLGALLRLERVTLTGKDLSGAQASFDRPTAPGIHLSKRILPSQELVHRLWKRISFFKTQGQNGGTLAAALLWAWSGGEESRLREISRGRDGFWIVAETLVRALQRSYENNLALAIAA